jgi:hypothetical protein
LLTTTPMMCASHVGVGSEVRRIANSHVNHVRIVAAADHLPWHRSIRISPRGKMPLAACPSELQPKTTLVAPRTAIATAMVADAVRVADQAMQCRN